MSAMYALSHKFAYGIQHLNKAHFEMSHSKIIHYD